RPMIEARVPELSESLRLDGASRSGRRCDVARRAIVAAALVALACLAIPARGEAAFHFGDLHAHSGLSDDASGAPDAFFTTARDIAGLDFVALSDHDAFIDQDEWAILRETAASFDRPGAFVAFSAIEWTHHWHMNIVFEAD